MRVALCENIGEVRVGSVHCDARNYVARAKRPGETKLRRRVSPTCVLTQSLGPLFVRIKMASLLSKKFVKITRVLFLMLGSYRICRLAVNIYVHLHIFVNRNRM